jgi:hypothetical protein
MNRRERRLSERKGLKMRKEIFKQVQKEYELMEKTGRFPSYFTEEMKQEYNNKKNGVDISSLELPPLDVNLYDNGM